MKKHIFFALFAILHSIIISCSVPEESEWYSRNSIDTTYTPTMIQASEIFSETNTASGSKMWHFRTNDTQYLKTDGCIVWNVSTIQNSTAPVTIRTIKQSGSPSEGFGLVYFYRTSQEHIYMILAMINVMQQYTVGKYADGTYTEIIPWTYSPLLSRGFGSSNDIGLSYNTSSKVFTLKLNGTAVDNFEDTQTPRLTTGRSGTVVGISQFENFPFSCVDVIFEEVQ